MIASSFSLFDQDPSPCFVFACHQTSAFDGDTLVAVGAIVPRVYVWVRDSSGQWSEQAVLSRPGEEEPQFDQEFGSLLAIDGDDLVVSGGALGGLLVYQRSGTTWSYRQTLPSSSYLDLEHGTIIATDESDFVIYEKGAGGSFRRRASLKLPSYVDGYLSGPVELDRNTAVIAGGDDADGAVFVFQRLFGLCFFAQKLAAPPAAAGGGFGAAVAIDRAQSPFPHARTCDVADEEQMAAAFAGLERIDGLVTSQPCFASATRVSRKNWAEPFIRG